MNLTLKKNIKGLLKKHRIRPSKKLGQNFLINNSVIKKIIKVANLQPKDIVLEIGPGIGVLTQELAKKTKKVITVEKDQKMCDALKETLKDFKNIEIINKDALKIKFQITDFKLQINSKFQIPKNYKIIANLPFYITAPVIRRFLEAKNPPKEMILMVQKEVAQRICASPTQVFAKQKFGRAKLPRLRQGFGGQAKMNLLAVSVQFYSKPKIISYVSKKSFWPSPKVDGAILQISRICTNLPQINTNLFFKIVKAGFSQPRKQLANNLSKGLKLNKAKVRPWLLNNNIQPKQRAETLATKDWINLTKTIDSK